ncbi:MAG: MoaD/ThiS family protein [Desulfotomaculaceae bacterium]|nr:MoaD/ThiS family protein [Desulfotomaculaceae bacterium]
MRLRIQVFGELIEHLKSPAGDGMFLELPEGTDIKTMLERLGLPSGHVGVVLLNGKFSNRDVILNHDDQVQIIPQLEGG